MGRFPQCKKFIAEEAPKFPSLEVKQVRGLSPVVLWLDKYGNTVSKTDIKETDTVADHYKIFADHGITPETPKPSFATRGFSETANCIAYRRHTTSKERLPRDDVTCDEVIPAGGGIGYCECKSGMKIEITVHPKRVRFTCENVCSNGEVPWANEEEEL